MVNFFIFRKKSDFCWLFGLLCRFSEKKNVKLSRMEHRYNYPIWTVYNIFNRLSMHHQTCSCANGNYSQREGPETMIYHV